MQWKGGGTCEREEVEGVPGPTHQHSQSLTVDHAADDAESADGPLDELDDTVNEMDDVLKHRRRTTSAFNRSNGLALSTTYLTVTYGGASAYYSLWLGEKCSSTVVVHLQFMSDTPAGKGTVLKLSCDRLVFTPENFSEPQIVRVDMVDQWEATNMILHRVFSLDKNYDRINTPNVVVKTEKSSVGSLLSLGGALVHKRKNAKGEIMEPRLAANRSIDLAKALVSSSTSTTTTSSALALAAAAALMEEDDDFCGSFSGASAAAPPAETPPPVFVSHMAAGNSFSAVVVKSQGGSETLLVWGMNSNGELGIGSTTPMVDPVPISLSPSQLLQQGSEPFSVVSVSCGKQHAAFVTAQGRLFTWGNNKYGQLGLGDYTNVDTPHEVTLTAALFRQSASHQRALRIKHAILDHGAPNVTQVACGAFHTLFVTHQQHVLSMGYNQAGQLGLGHRLQQHKGWRSCTPVMIEALRDSCILDLAAGQNHSACVRNNGDVYVWGSGGDGRLGVPLGGQSQSDCELKPVQVLSLKDIGVKARSIRCGARHTAIISDHDLLYVWGANEFGQLGLGDKRTRQRPCLVQFQPFLREGVVDVALGEFHSACVTWAGNAYVWGLDLSGEQSTRLDQRCLPERITLPENEGAVQVACGWAHTTLLTQEARDDGDSGSTDGSAKFVPFHRRKARAHQFSSRQQEATKWRRVSSALAVMGRLQHRVSVWRKKDRKKPKNGDQGKPKLRFLDVVAGAFKHSRRNLHEESQRMMKEEIDKAATEMVADAIDQATKRAVVQLLVMRRTAKPKRPKSGKVRRTKRDVQQQRTPRRPQSSPAARPPQGVFYHNALQDLSPPVLPPPLTLPSASCPSPRHVVVTGASSPMKKTSCTSPTPTPPSTRSRERPHSVLSPSPRTLRSSSSAVTSSCASLLSALQEDGVGDEEERRAPTLATPRGTSRSAKAQRLTAVESLLRQPSFSITHHLAAQRPRPPRTPRDSIASPGSFR